MKSIIDNEKVCLLCGDNRNIEKHHIYGAGNRGISERNGFWVYLCHRCHMSLHDHREEDLMLKTMCQKQYEKKHTRKEFMKLIGRNYLEEE